jgi:hypothetical protein
MVYLDTQVEVSYIVEARRGDRPWIAWIAMSNTGNDEELGRKVYEDWLASKRRTGSTLQYQLVRRTAVITDEVIEQEGK